MYLALILFTLNVVYIYTIICNSKVTITTK